MVPSTWVSRGFSDQFFQKSWKIRLDPNHRSIQNPALADVLPPTARRIATRNRLPLDFVGTLLRCFSSPRSLV